MVAIELQQGLRPGSDALTFDQGTCELATAPRFAVDRIENVEVIVTNQGYHDLVCTPLEAKRRPSNLVESRCRRRHDIAVCQGDGELTLDHFTADSLTRKDQLALAAIVACRVQLGAEEERRLRTATSVVVHFENCSCGDYSASGAPGHPHIALDGERAVGRLPLSCRSVSRDLHRDGVERIAGYVTALEEEADGRGWLSSRELPVRRTERRLAKPAIRLQGEPYTKPDYGS